MEGYLLKWTNYVFGWQRRYFILYNGVLHYCKEKGSAQRGTLHLDISEISKHKDNPKRFSISTGLTCVYLKAYTIEEARDWYRALTEQQLDLKFPKTPMDAKTVSTVIMDKVTAMWGIHSQLLSSIEQIPVSVVKAHKSLESLMSLLGEMKKVSANTLGIIEHEHQNIQKLPMNINRFSCEGAPYEDDEFEDAIGSDEAFPERKCLPLLRAPKHKKVIWKYIQDTIDLPYYKIQAPMNVYEPLSLLQRISEEMAYYKMLTDADMIDDSCKRLAYVSAFVVSSYMNTKRTTKPFSPLVGETFELRFDELSLVLEQVSKDVTALSCKHPSFVYWNSTELASQFVENKLEISVLGPCYLYLIGSRQRYTWSRPSITIKDLQSGRVKKEIEGEVRITCDNSEEYSVIRFFKNSIEGLVYDGYKVIWKLKVGESIEIYNDNENIVLKGGNKYPDAYEYNYYFSLFALQLNLPPFLFPGLPATDSRYRKDIRLFENGEFKQANNEYSALITKSEANKSYMPKWFQFNNNSWEFNEKYWDFRTSN